MWCMLAFAAQASVQRQIKDLARLEGVFAMSRLSVPQDQAVGQGDNTPPLANHRGNIIPYMVLFTTILDRICLYIE